MHYFNPLLKFEIYSTALVFFPICRQDGNVEESRETHDLASVNKEK